MLAVGVAGGLFSGAEASPWGLGSARAGSGGFWSLLLPLLALFLSLLESDRRVAITAHSFKYVFEGGSSSRGTSGGFGFGFGSESRTGSLRGAGMALLTENSSQRIPSGWDVRNLRWRFGGLNKARRDLKGKREG